MIIWYTYTLLKILKWWLQHYVNWELQDLQAGFRKGRWTRDQIADIHWIILKARKFQWNIYLGFINYVKAFDFQNKVWKILKEIGIPDNLTCLPRNLFAGQEVTVRTVHETTDWLQIGKGVRQGCILSSCLLTYMQSSSSVIHSVISNSLQPYGLWPTRLLCPWDSPGKNTGEDCHFLLQRIFMTQGLNQVLQHCRQILYRLSYIQSASCEMMGWMKHKMK